MSKEKHSKKDETLETLLDLDGEVFRMENSYWTKFTVKEVVPSPQVPHGIKYCLTLHDPKNTRVLGFDNAHHYKPKKKNTEPEELPGITNTRRKLSRHMNLNLPASCLRTFG